MLPRNRAVLRWAFILIFLIVAPIIILSTAGYRFNFGTARIERTGVIVIDTTPSGAKVSLNGLPTGATTPAHLSHAFPGDQGVRLEKPGFHTWEKSVRVEEGSTVFLNDVVLFRDALPLVEREAVGVTASSVAPDGRFVGFVSGERGISEVHVFDADAGTDHLLLRAPYASGNFDISWSDDGRRLLIIRRGAGTTIDLWDAGTPDALLDVGTLMPQPPTQAFWGDDGLTLFTADANELYTIDPLARIATATGLAVEALSVVNGSVYGLKETKGVLAAVHRRLGDDAFTVIVSVPKGHWKALPSPDGVRLAFLSDDGRLEVVDATAKTIVFEGRARDGAWSPDGKRLLYWNDFELHIFDAPAHTDDLVTRLGSLITSAAWAATGRSILFVSGGMLAAVESGHAGDRLVTPLATMQDIKDFTLPRTQDVAWIAGVIGHASGIFSLQLK